MPPPNAAIYYVPEGYSTAGAQLMGINVASEGMLRGFARHAGVERLYAFCEGAGAGLAFAQAVGAWDPRLATEWIAAGDIDKIAPLGTLMLPGPGLGAYAWARRRVGAGAFSLCGVTHTTATPLALDALTDLLVAPVEPWDAVVCPSRTVRAMVAALLEDQLSYLEERFGRLSQVRPQLPVIPLGIDGATFAPDPAARAAARAGLGVSDDEVVLLYAGRLNPAGKSHPIPLFLAAAMAAARAKAPLRLLLCGWFADADIEAAYREAAEMICPDVPLTIVDGRISDTRARAWAGADIFVSPVDNIQETFGLTPLEAMAAGLPVIASDWDGYRDTVRQGVDGLLIQTWTPPPGQGGDLARGYGARVTGYEAYVGAAAQATAIDTAAFAEAIAALADDPDRRAAMGAAGCARAGAEFDWARIIPQYQELWVELASRRRQASPPVGLSNPYPARPDPFRAFAGYPSRFIRPDTRLRPGRTAPEMIEVLLASPLIVLAAPSLPAAATLAGMVEAVEAGPATVAAILEAHGETEALWRGLGWLAKYGFVQLEP